MTGSFPRSADLTPLVLGRRSWPKLQRREFHEALLEAARFEDLSGKWQAAIVSAEHNRPKLRLVTGDA